MRKILIIVTCHHQAGTRTNLNHQDAKAQRFFLFAAACRAKVRRRQEHERRRNGWSSCPHAGLKKFLRSLRVLLFNPCLSAPVLQRKARRRIHLWLMTVLQEETEETEIMKTRKDFSVFSVCSCSIRRDFCVLCDLLWQKISGNQRLSAVKKFSCGLCISWFD
jgi:hypothetical protein